MKSPVMLPMKLPELPIKVPTKLPIKFLVKLPVKLLMTAILWWGVFLKGVSSEAVNICDESLGGDQPKQSNPGGSARSIISKSEFEHYLRALNQAEKTIEDYKRKPETYAQILEKIKTQKLGLAAIVNELFRKKNTHVTFNLEEFIFEVNPEKDGSALNRAAADLQEKYGVRLGFDYRFFGSNQSGFTEAPLVLVSIEDLF